MGNKFMNSSTVKPFMIKRKQSTCNLTTKKVLNIKSARTNKSEINKKIKPDRTSNFLTHRPRDSSPMSTRLIWMSTQLLINSRNVEWLQIKEIEAIKYNDEYIYIIQEIENLPAKKSMQPNLYTSTRYRTNIPRTQN